MTPTRHQVLEQVQTVLRNLLLNDTLSITESSRLEDIPEWDSMLHVALLLALERAFGVSLTAREAADCVAIGPILDILSTKLSITS